MQETAYINQPNLIYDHTGIQIINDHVPNALKNMPDEFVNCVVTSPPYWGLRDYGLPPQIWDAGINIETYSAGGEEFIDKYPQKDCEHQWGTESKKSNRWGGIETISNKQASNHGAYQTAGDNALSQGQFCQKCNAWKGSLGLEPTPELYIQHMVQVFREIQRVLRKDGSVWLNLGDSYNGSGGAGGDYNKGGLKEGQPKYGPKKTPTLKPKDLCGIPWRVALALQADGWWLRSDIIWHKPNPMPESCRDRCTKSHEYIFMLTKSAKYFYDIDAIREPHKGDSGWAKQRAKNEDTWKYTQKRRGKHTKGKFGSPTFEHKNGRNKRSVWTIDEDEFKQFLKWKAEHSGDKTNTWTITTQRFKGAHFATFPEEIPRLCISAGCPKDGTVLDPFMGSGRTLIVAKKLGRKAIGIELNPEYAEMPIKYLSQDNLL